MTDQSGEQHIVANLVLMAPMKGWVGPLEEVPDPVFAERLLGDGLAIDPTGNTVHAPCDGVIASAAGHAVTLRAACGAELLIHVGLETVALHGQGFVTHAREGRSVKTGDPLLTFDLDFLATKAKSLVTPVIVTNGEEFAIVRRGGGRATAVGEFLMELKPLRVTAEAGADGSGAAVSREAVIALAHGIHARPAAVLSNAAKRFVSDVSLVRDGRSVNAKSVMALMALGVRQGDTVCVLASGADARQAVDALAELIAAGLGETPAERGAVAEKPEAVVPRPVSTTARLAGVRAAPGLAVGRIAHVRAADIAVDEAGRGVAHETAAFAQALGAVRARVELAAGTGDRQRREILGAHIALLDDPELGEAARAAIAEGKSAGFAWRRAVGVFADALKAMDDARMRERANDLLDLERQVLAELSGKAVLARPAVPQGAILVADELLPSELIALGTGSIAGFATARGGPTSHVAILAAGMNMPALVSLGAAVLDLAEGTEVVLDADAGELDCAPRAEAVAAARAKLATREAQSREAASRAGEDCRTAEGTRIEIFANLGAGAAEAAQAVAHGAEGCGLLRTEFLFQDRAVPPTEDEQAAQYQAIADALEGRPFIIRTFDIGGDKPVPYLPFPPEENPALGLRGVRAGLWKPDLLRTQLAAILRVKPQGQCRIMLPMVTAVTELTAVRAMLADLARERGLSKAVSLGVMIETPASAVLADRIAGHADFFSVGTNDLTQYVLAMDRGHPQLAPQIDALHPAVLRLIRLAVQGAGGKPVGVCGGLAADALAAPLLIGLGVAELSVPSSGIPLLKQTVRGLRDDACGELAENALARDSADDVRALLQDFMSGKVTR